MATQTMQSFGLHVTVYSVAFLILVLADPVRSRSFFETLPEPTCNFNRGFYRSGEMVSRQDPCDFCFCYKGEVLCWKRQCPPPPTGGDKCAPHYENNECCPRYLCNSLKQETSQV